jgi:hypothetical protein
MAKKAKKGAVGVGKGVMCNICGLNCGKGGALKKHVEAKHAPVTYDAYKTCFYGSAKNVLADAWDDSVSTNSGNTVVTHVFVRRFVQEPGPRGATRAVRKQPKAAKKKAAKKKVT